MNQSINIVESSGHLQCSKQQAWDKVCFYEHIRIKPSLLLRTVLPVPMRTSGRYENVGDTSRCIYSDGGYLTKEITRVDNNECIEFDIIEQSIRYYRSIKLLGGAIRVVEHDDGSCSVEMTTHYRRGGPANFIPKYFIDFVVKAMHKIVVRDMQVLLGETASSKYTSSCQLPARHRNARIGN